MGLGGNFGRGGEGVEWIGWDVTVDIMHAVHDDG
jgi:hypothetical protein